MSYRKKGLRKPTWTSVLLAELVGADDLVETSDLRARVGCTKDQLWATLSDLRRYRAIDSVESCGSLYWFATPQCDTRIRHLDEIAAEITRRRMGGLRAKRAAAQSQPSNTEPTP